MRMLALTMTRYGGRDALALIDLPTPEPGPGEVRLRVAAAGLNPVDRLQRDGTFRALSPYRFPKIVGNELSGEVDAVGAGVSAWSVGDRVIARVDKNGLGACAEAAVVAADLCAGAPESIPLTDAAGLPLAGLTALQALGPEHLDLRREDRLLITGAAGAVGQFAIQLAARTGARITVTASPEGEAIVRGLGADAVIDYRARHVSEGPERFTKVLDLVGGDTLTDLVASVEREGRIVSVSGPPTPGSLMQVTDGPRRPIAWVAEHVRSRAVRRIAANAGVSYEFFLMRPDGEQLAHLARLVDQGSLHVPIDARFPLDEYAAGIARLESRRAKGKVLLVL